jgi:hypothetical protein
LSGVASIATDGTDVYWIDAKTVSRVPVGGGAVTILVTTWGTAERIAVDTSAIFWTSSGDEIDKMSPK